MSHICTTMQHRHSVPSVAVQHGQMHQAQVACLFRNRNCCSTDSISIASQSVTHVVLLRRMHPTLSNSHLHWLLPLYASCQPTWNRDLPVLAFSTHKICRKSPCCDFLIIDSNVLLCHLHSLFVSDTMYVTQNLIQFTRERSICIESLVHFTY